MNTSDVIRLQLFCLAAVLISGCGNPEGTPVAPAPEEVTQGTNAVAKPDEKKTVLDRENSGKPTIYVPAKPLSPDQLAEILPTTVEGLTAGESHQEADVKGPRGLFSRVERTFKTEDGKELIVRVIDGREEPGLLSAAKELVGLKNQNDVSDNKISRHIKIGEHRGHELWSAGIGSRVQVLLHKRFVLEMFGIGMSLDELHEHFASGFDLFRADNILQVAVHQQRQLEP